MAYHALRKVMPSGVSSAARAFPGLGIDPLIVNRAVGDCLYDLDGKAYIDLCMSWGAALHGHTPPRKAVLAQIERGTSYGVSCPLEGELAAKIVDLVPSAEQVRFVSSGTEATMSALRLARGVTGRDNIVLFDIAYHGHADSLLTRSAGIPAGMTANTLIRRYNEELRLDETVAAVIVEPVAGNHGVVVPKEGWLAHLRKETERVGALLIFDEVITGFRVARGGAQERYGVVPDLTCLGKIMGGGFPAAAFAGPRAIMSHLAPEGDVYQAGTLSGNPVAMAAGLTALDLLDRPGFYEELEQRAERFVAPFGDVISRVGSMFSFSLEGEAFKRLFSTCLEAGIYLSPSRFEANFLSLAHTDDHLAYVQDVVGKSLAVLV